MHRYRRRLSRAAYTTLGVAAGSGSSTMIYVYGVLSWQALLSYVVLAVLVVAARRADRYIAAMARRIARAPSSPPPSERPVSGRADW